MSAPVLFLNVMWLSYVLHCCNEGCSHGQSVLIILIWSCASEVICQRSGSHELLQIGRGDREHNSAVNYDSYLKSSKNWREQQREAHTALVLPLFLLTATGLIQPLDGRKQHVPMHGEKQRAARGLLTLPALLREEQRKCQQGTAKNGISSIQA